MIGFNQDSTSNTKFPTSALDGSQHLLLKGSDKVIVTWSGGSWAKHGRVPNGQRQRMTTAEALAEGYEYLRALTAGELQQRQQRLEQCRQQIEQEAASRKRK